MRLGIFGGSFDPVHYGHLLLAECCREQAKLDEVWFVPAAHSPHKRDHAPAPGDDRLAMLELAIGGHEQMRTSRLELARGGVSYTVETLAAVKVDRPDAELFLLLGADSLADLPNWREPRRICELATPLVVHRAGSPQPDFDAVAPLVDSARLAAIRGHVVDMPGMDLSSRDLRRRVAAGQSIRFRVPRPVEKYIEMAGLYRK